MMAMTLIWFFFITTPWPRQVRASPGIAPTSRSISADARELSPPHLCNPAGSWHGREL